MVQNRVGWGGQDEAFIPCEKSRVKFRKNPCVKNVKMPCKNPPQQSEVKIQVGGLFYKVKDENNAEF